MTQVTLQENEFIIKLSNRASDIVQNKADVHILVIDPHSGKGDEVARRLICGMLNIAAKLAEDLVNGKQQ